MVINLSNKSIGHCYNVADAVEECDTLIADCFNYGYGCASTECAHTDEVKPPRRCESANVSLKRSNSRVNIARLLRTHGLLALMVLTMVTGVVEAHSSPSTAQGNFGDFVAICLYVACSAAGVLVGSSLIFSYINEGNSVIDNDVVRTVGCTLFVLAIVGLCASAILAAARQLGCGKFERCCHLALQTSVGVLVNATLISLGLCFVLICENFTSDGGIPSADKVVVMAIDVVLGVKSLIILVVTGGLLGAVIKPNHCDDKMIIFFAFTILIQSLIELAMGNILGGGCVAFFHGKCAELIDYGTFSLLAQVLGCMTIASVASSMLIDYVRIGSNVSLLVAATVGIKAVLLDHLNFLRVVSILICILIISSLVTLGVLIGATIVKGDGHGQHSARGGCSSSPGGGGHEHEHHGKGHSHGNGHGHHHGDEQGQSQGRSNQSAPSGSNGAGGGHTDHEHVDKGPPIHIAINSSGAVMFAVSVTSWFAYKFIYENFVPIASFELSDLLDELIS
ncbi:uncharacterized protein BXIN_2757 [Babesia sp. Xinjiang]|uniref:uncharacterized protein n=1 Tax=Babesia sp. Xinjiang TaxID=462227 RepID=UPI000A26586B|nr:uncharacterized protein BXIN_2757 [Babesia sp. Xinjiang]ORM41703.1 hypothetical protein BXIN_2757 [Babesia sp. Xinjiang]